MPTKVAVDKPNGYSTQHLKLGGKSQRTKDIRSATPRGFAIAVHDANKVDSDEAKRLEEFDRATDDAIRDRLETEGVV